MIRIDNDGPNIRSTNYWSSEHARRGLFFLSWNAGAARLLVPAAQVAAGVLTEMATAEYVILTRGPWPEAQNRMSWEILFEDRSDAPYALHLVPEQSDRAIPPADIGRHCRFSAWTEAGQALDRPGRIRSASVLPHMRPWAGEGRA